MKRTPVNRRCVAVGVGAMALLLATACTPPGQDEQDASEVEPIIEPVTPEEIADLGDIELDVWAEAGEEETLNAFVPQFEERYPNVTVQVSVRSIDDLVTTVVNALSGEDPPDVAQGNQGFGTDGALVEAGLIRPLEDLAEVYGWNESFSDQLLGPMRWEGDGSQFRAGDLYGVSPVANNIGVFYNADVLDDAGVDVPTTFGELEDALAAVESNGDLPIVLGNAEQWPALHVYGALLGSFADADEVNEWVSGTDGATFETDDNLDAAQRLADWTEAGYFGQAYNSVGVDDAAARFGAGEGAFMIAGDWYAPAVIEGGGDQFGFIAPPEGPSGSLASIGSVSFPWHISSHTDAEPAAIAFVAEMNSVDNSLLLAEANRIPVQAGDDVESPGPMAADLTAVNEALMAADGQIDYLDWATPDLYSTFGSELQSLMAGRIDPSDFLAAIQADWDDFHEER
ncbi:ABC transporter substrate-binding protein [Aeromicrobium sp. CTD01-1L150]|uniref:ABC transporter substrate-binding protein n=1 Tax=Aeromicrobium sp. CTD01-1L150 TaxID=3341830 RepID=UPI0035C075F6